MLCRPISCPSHALTSGTCDHTPAIREAGEYASRRGFDVDSIGFRVWPRVCRGIDAAAGNRGPRPSHVVVVNPVHSTFSARSMFSAQARGGRRSR